MIRDYLEPPMDNTLVAGLRRAGLKLTTPRLAVLRVLDESHAHLTPAEILERGREIAPTLNHATVYRALETLTALGLVRPLYLGDGLRRFTVVEDGHHHMVCSACHSVVEFEECEIERIWPDLAARSGFRMDGHLLEIYGLCRSCQ
jgi:Fur family ferric uptake transcriptional regulator